MAMEKKGFSVVEIMSPCPTAYGRRNKMGSGLRLMQDLKENSVSSAKAEKMSEEELEGKIVTGILVDRDIPEYTAEYQKLIDQVQKS
jgi:2-oxoglutarate ferredoxin oxidoreductase subunit beta